MYPYFLFRVIFRWILGYDFHRTVILDGISRCRTISIGRSKSPVLQHIGWIGHLVLCWDQGRFYCYILTHFLQKGCFRVSNIVVSHDGVTPFIQHNARSTLFTFPHAQNAWWHIKNRQIVS